MIQETYVSYEVAKLLKEKRFDEPCRSYFIDNVDYIDFSYSTEELTDLHMGVREILRPTHQMAMDWLREIHQVAIVIDCWFGGDRYISWHGKIMCYGEDLKTQQDVELPYVATYKEAVEAAIKYALENLI